MLLLALVSHLLIDCEDITARVYKRYFRKGRLESAHPLCTLGPILWATLKYFLKHNGLKAYLFQILTYKVLNLSRSCWCLPYQTFRDTPLEQHIVPRAVPSPGILLHPEIRFLR